MNMLLLVTTVWPLSQVSRYVGLIAQKKFDEVRRAFWRMLAGSTLFAALLAVGLVYALEWMNAREVPFAGRLADTTTTGALVLAALVHHVVHCFAVVLRAERQEPLLTASVLGGLLTVMVVWLSAHYGSVRDIALANLACASIGIPIVLVYYRRLSMRALANEGRPISRPT
jgi:Na+-driven multidrug efflux pump